MEIIITAIIAWLIAQLIKIAVHLFKYKEFKPSLLIATGSMPSSHTAFVTAATVRVGMIQGVESTLFGVCAVFSLVIMQDAVGVRQSVGIQAQAINVIHHHLKALNIDLDKIKEVWGHSFFQVMAGFFLGIAVGLFV